jgi:four helix bundle protein
MTQNPNKYDLEDRTAKFSEVIIRLCLNLTETNITKPLISQLVRTPTSIGANYGEADDSKSPKDFKHKIGIAKKETRESIHFSVC